MKPKLFHFLLHLIPILLFISFLVWIIYAFSPQTIYSDVSPPDSGVTPAKWNLTPNYYDILSSYNILSCTRSSDCHFPSPAPTTRVDKSSHLQTKRPKRALQAVQKEPTLLPTIKGG